jgi:hypothetical protein
MTQLQAAIGVSTSNDALLDLFECISNLLKRLHFYAERIPMSPMMSDMVVKIMGEVLAVLGLATKQIKQGRFSKWFHRLQNVPDQAHCRNICQEIPRR